MGAITGIIAQLETCVVAAVAKMGGLPPSAQTVAAGGPAPFTRRLLGERPCPRL